MTMLNLHPPVTAWYHSRSFLQRWDRLAGVCALLYLISLFFDFRLVPPLCDHDLLAPVMLLHLWLHRHELPAFFQERGHLLPGFLLLAGISTFYHLLRGTGGLYDLAVFAYMAILYLYFRLALPSPALRFRLGLGMLAILTLAYLAGLLLQNSAESLGRLLFHLDPEMHHKGTAFLARRYMFFFLNPNQLGSFYALPVALLLPGLQQRAARFCRWWQWLLLALASAICLMPLLSSTSKHAILTLALLCGFVASLPVLQRWRPARWAWMPLVLFGLLSLTTVLFRTFPLSERFPWLNLRERGNYTIHQEIHLKSTLSRFSSILLGNGDKSRRLLYPQYADRATVTRILRRYDAEAFTDVYCSYMDPHNEYINLAAMFGLPAMLFALAFWLRLAGFGYQRQNWPLLYYCIGVLFACLWDDLLSKRWVWITLAILISTALPAAMATPKQDEGPAAQS